MKKTTVREYDKEGLLVRETITEEYDKILDDLKPFIEPYKTPRTAYPDPRWERGTLCITC
jgi:hypothetical protein